MSSPTKRAGRHTDVWSDPGLVVASAERWAEMSPAEWDDEEARVARVLDDYGEALSESTLQSRPRADAYKDLSEHFGRAGRRVFLATELLVLYPGETAMMPDLLAVMDVEDADVERNSWRVPDEGRGVDLILEFRDIGNRHRTLQQNVETYARLGIAEYFSYDCRLRRVRGYRLASPSARTYEPIAAQAGSSPSQVLGLQLGVADGRLRFFKDLADAPASDDLLGSLLNDAFEDKLEDMERQRNEAVAELRRARESLVEALLRRVAGRGLALSKAQIAAIHRCEDLARLLGMLERASVARTSEEIVGG